MRSGTRGPVLTPGILAEVTWELGFEQCAGAERGQAGAGGHPWKRSTGPSSSRKAHGAEEGPGLLCAKPSDADLATLRAGPSASFSRSKRSQFTLTKRSLHRGGCSRASHGQFPGSRKREDRLALWSHEWNPPRFL